MTRAKGPREGDEELSAKKRSETEGAANSRRSRKSASSSGRGDARGRKNDLGRALRSVYDDTLRESVPDDILNIIGKLS
jgi:hypothetical protein